jgi:hypothetical protein
VKRVLFKTWTIIPLDRKTAIGINGVISEWWKPIENERSFRYIAIDIAHSESTLAVLVQTSSNTAFLRYKTAQRRFISGNKIQL